MTSKVPLNENEIVAHAMNDPTMESSPNEFVKHFKIAFIKGEPTRLDFFLAHLPMMTTFLFIMIVFGFSPEMSLGLAISLEDDLLAALLTIILSHFILGFTALSLTEWELKEKAHVNFYKYYRYVLGVVLAIGGIVWFSTILNNLEYRTPNLLVLIFTFSTLTRIYPAFMLSFFDMLQVSSAFLFMILIALISTHKIYQHLSRTRDVEQLETPLMNAPASSLDALSKHLLSPPMTKKMPFGLRLLTWGIFLEQTMVMPYILKGLFIDMLVFSTILTFHLGILANILTWIFSGLIILNGFEIPASLGLGNQNNQRQLTHPYLRMTGMGLAAFLLIFNLIGFHVTYSLTSPSYLTIYPQPVTENIVLFYLFRLALPKFVYLMLLTWSSYQLLQGRGQQAASREDQITHELDISEAKFNVINLLDKRPSRSWIILANLPFIIYFLVRFIVWNMGTDVFQLLMLYPRTLSEPLITPWLYFYLPETLIFGAVGLNFLLGRRGYPTIYLTQAALLFVLGVTTFYHAGWHFEILNYRTLHFTEVLQLPRVEFIPNLILYFLLLTALGNLITAIKIKTYRASLKSALKNHNHEERKSTTQSDAGVQLIRREFSRTTLGMHPIFVYLIILFSFWPLQYLSPFIVIVLVSVIAILLAPSSSDLLAAANTLGNMSEVMSRYLVEILFIGPILWLIPILASSMVVELKQYHQDKKKTIEKRFNGLLLLVGTVIILSLLGFEFLLSPSVIASILILAWMFLEKMRIGNIRGEPLPQFVQSNLRFLKIFNWYAKNTHAWLTSDEMAASEIDENVYLKNWWTSPERLDEFQRYRAHWMWENQTPWNVAAPGIFFLLIIVTLLLPIIQMAESYYILEQVEGILASALGNILVITIILSLQFTLLRLLQAKERAEPGLFLIPASIGGLLLLMTLLVLQDLFVLGLTLSSYLIISNLVMYKKQKELREQHKKIESETDTHVSYKVLSSHFRHLPMSVVMSLQLLILYHFPELLLLPITGLLDEITTITAILTIIHYYHASSNPIFNGILYVTDFWMSWLAYNLLSKDFQVDSPKISSISYLLTWMLVGKSVLVFFSLFLSSSINIFTIVTTLFLLSILGTCAFYCNRLSKGMINPIPDFTTKSMLKTAGSLYQQQMTTDDSKHPAIETPSSSLVDTRPSRAVVSKQQILIRETVVPPPSQEEIQWAEMKAREFVLMTLKDQGYIEIDQLPKYVGRVEVNFKKILARLQFEGGITVVWGSDGSVVYEETYLEKELLRYISRNRSITAAELAQKFNLEVDTISFKLKRWFVDGRLN